MLYPFFSCYMANKRYRPSPAASLLSRILKTVQGRSTTKATIRVARALLSERFFREVGVTIKSSADGTLNQWDDDKARTWREGVLAVLEDVIDDVAPYENLRAEQYWVEISLDPARPPITIHGDLNPMLDLRLDTLLRSVGIDRVLRCECKQLFVKYGRREFCSDRCQKRVYMRKWWKEKRDGKPPRKK